MAALERKRIGAKLGRVARRLVLGVLAARRFVARRRQLGAVFLRQPFRRLLQTFEIPRRARVERRFFGTLAEKLLGRFAQLMSALHLHRQILRPRASSEPGY